MSRGKQCSARAVIFIHGEKMRARCDHYVDYHHDQEIANRTFEIVPLPHSKRFADGRRVTWERDGEIIWA